MSALRTEAKHGVLGGSTRELRTHFFKADQPRGIDRYIDYFGGGVSPAWTKDSVYEWSVLVRLSETG
ncbi:MAG TPA: hypothetical protein VGL09_13530 [Methylomirabilota bacterium]|jgi:hypothetical protein